MADTPPIASSAHFAAGQDSSDSAGTIVVPTVVRPVASYEVRARYTGVVVWQDWQRRDREVERVSAGTPMTVRGDAGTYLEVDLASGQRGFVAAAAVAMAPEE